MGLMEMRFLRRLENIKRGDRLRNNLKITPIEKVIEERHLRWIDYIHRTGDKMMIKKSVK